MKIRRRIIHGILLMLSCIPCLFSQNYSAGDTLYVVALNGLNLRETASLKGSKISMLTNGEQVVVLTSGISQQDSIDGFKGNWVKVHSLSDKVDGFVFDAFISRYPVVSNFEYIKDFVSGKYRWSDDEMFDFLPAMLNEYALRAFRPGDCHVQYSNGSDGEGFFSLAITQLNNQARLVIHGYSEGHGTELELSNARMSEIYYLVLNILKYLPPELQKINGEKLKITVEYGQRCIDYGENACLIRIIFKGGNKISILFNNACC